MPNRRRAQTRSTNSSSGSCQATTPLPCMSIPTLGRVGVGRQADRRRRVAVDRVAEHRPEAAVVAGDPDVGADVARRVGGAGVGDHHGRRGRPARRAFIARSGIGRGRLADVEVDRHRRLEAVRAGVERGREHAVAADAELLHPGDDQAAAVAGADPRPARVEVLADVDSLRRAARPPCEAGGEDVGAAVDPLQVDDAAVPSSAIAASPTSTMSALGPSIGCDGEIGAGGGRRASRAAGADGEREAGAGARAEPLPVAYAPTFVTKAIPSG